MNLAKLVSLSIALILIQACSHPIEIVGEGDVTSASGNRNCSLEDFQAAKTNCTKNYAIGAYQETYYATPRAGYTFDHWGNNYCPDAAPPNYECSFNIPAATVQKYWGQTMPPLKAVFTSTSVGTPIGLADIVTVTYEQWGVPPLNGREWAQPDLFTGLSYNEVIAVCPGGICITGGVLNGHDMTDWKWALQEDLIALFNYYISGTVSEPLLPEIYINYTAWGEPEQWSSRILSDFRASPGNYFGLPAVYGWGFSQNFMSGEVRAALRVILQSINYASVLEIGYTGNTDDQPLGVSGDGGGLFFYRDCPTTGCQYPQSTGADQSKESNQCVTSQGALECTWDEIYGVCSCNWPVP
jgi:hypothetical protein